MPIGAHEYFSCGCSIFTFQATCTLYLCRGHNDLKPRLLERGYNPRQHVQSIGLEFAPGPAPAFTKPPPLAQAQTQPQAGNQFNFPQTHTTVQNGNFHGFPQVPVRYQSNCPQPYCNVPHANFQGSSQAQAGYQTNFPQTHDNFQNADFQSSPDNRPSFTALMAQFCNQAQEEEDNELGADPNQSDMSGSDGEGSQNNYPQNGNSRSQSIEDVDPDIKGEVSQDAMPANNPGSGNEPGDTMETTNPDNPIRIDDLQDTILDASVPFLHSVIAAARNASTTELRLSIQATANALYEAIKSGLDEAISLRDIDINCECANVKHWIQDIKEGRSTLEDMEMGLWLSGEGKDLGRQMNAERIKDRILRDCMETLSKNF